MANGLLIVRNERRRYAVRRDDLESVRLIAGPVDLAGSDRNGRAPIGVELGAVLEGAAPVERARRHALTVLLRRRSIMLLVDEVEDFLEHPAVHPIPALLRDRLREPWAVGALLLGEEIVVQIDLRAVARSILTSQEGRFGGAALRRE
jgi:hypothetical protein